MNRGKPDLSVLPKMTSYFLKGKLSGREAVKGFRGGKKC